MISRGRELALNTAIFAIGNIGSKFIMFLLVPLYTNYLTPAEYGISDFIFTMSQILVIVFSLAIFEAVVRYGLTDGAVRENVLLAASNVWLVGAALLILLTLIFSAAFGEYGQWKWYICGYSIASIALQIEMSYLKVKNRNKLYSIISLTQALFLGMLNILLIVILDTGIDGYLLANTIATVIAVVAAFGFGGLGKDFRKAKSDRFLFKQMVVFSAPLIMNNISWWIIHSSDKWMINWMISATALGYYTTASKIPSLLNSITNIFAQAWGLSAIKEVETTNEGDFFSGVLRIYTMLIFLVCIIINMFIKPFMMIYVGEAFTISWKYVPPLIVAALFSAIASFYGVLYNALKKTASNMVTTLIAAGINIIANYIFIRYYDVWGAIIGTCICYFVLAVIRTIHMKRYFQIQIQWAKQISSVILILFQMVCVIKDYHPFLLSGLTLCIFTAVNWRDIITIIKGIHHLLKLR